MIYYRDTLRFYKRHSREIGALLQRTMGDIGEHDPSKIFRDWDANDPLAQDDTNRNLLAWFAFEETARNLAHTARAAMEDEKRHAGDKRAENLRELIGFIENKL